MGDQFRFAGQAREVELHHLPGSLGGLLARPQGDEQAGDESQVDLDFDAVVAGGQQVAATQNALEPTEEQFHRPTITVSEGHQFRRQIEAIGEQPQFFGAAIGLGAAHYDQTHGPLEVVLVVAGTEFGQDDIADDACGGGFGRSRPIR